MATKTINLNSRNMTHGTPEFRVYTKTNWDAEFVLQTDVLVEELVWSVAPAISTATLHYRYGTVKQPRSDVFETKPPANSRGWFVLIIVTGDAGDPPLHWLGFVESAVTTQVFPGDSGGVQVIPCYGMDRLLQMTPLDTTVFMNPDDDAEEESLRRDFAAPWNPRKPGNRTEERVEIKQDVESYVFATPEDRTSQWWSTRNVFEYLIQCHLTAGEQGSGKIPWRIAGDISVLPEWDRPTIAVVDQRSIHDVSTELLGPDRMLGWSVQSVVTGVSNLLETTPQITEVQIVPFSRLESPLTLPSVGVMPANGLQIDWQSEQDAATDAQVQTDDSDVYDQIVIRGPREIGIGTFLFEDVVTPAWKLALREAYETAYSDQAGWANLQQYEKAEWNAYFRGQTKYAEVYRNYRFKKDWDGKCDSEAVFLDGDDGEGGPITYVPYLGNMNVLDQLPLFRGVDYEGAADEIDEAEGRLMLPMLAFIQRAVDDGTYTTLQDSHSVYGAPPVRNPNKLAYDVSVTANNEQGPGFAITISGAPAHALTPTFVPNDGDPEQINPKIWGGLNIAKMIVTAALQGDRRPEYRIPDQMTGDTVRRRIVTLEHPGLQSVHIATATVVGLDRTGDKLTSDGGVLRDPMPQLEALARIAEKSLLQPRKTVSIRTGRMVGGINVGNLIKSVNGEMVNAVIRQIRISSPVVEDDSPPPTIMSIEASTNEIDLVALVGRVPEPELIDR